MKINMRMHWLFIKKGLPDVSKKTLKNIWEFLQDIEENFRINKPETVISIPLYPKNCSPLEKERICRMRKNFLNNFEQAHKILKIKDLTQDPDFPVVKITEKEFYEFYKKIGAEFPEDESNNIYTEKWFNPKSNSLHFEDRIYKPRTALQGVFVRALVGKHQEEKPNGKVLKEGKREEENVLATCLNTTSQELKKIRKQLNRTFKEKSLPLEIDLNSEGVLLILRK